jgi:GNAT superfamily N-acetyltransferase
MALAPRAYRDADLPRLQRALAEWIAGEGPCGYCHVGEVAHRIVEELAARGTVTELVRVWEDGGAVGGFSIEHRFDGAFEVFASPAVRGTDVEVEMLRVAADAEAARSSVEPITDVWVGDDRRVAALHRLGFEQYRLWDHILQRPLAEPIAPASVPDGFGVRLASIADAPGLARARADAFGGRSEASVLRAVLTQPGFPARREVVVVAPNGDIAAFAGVWIDRRNRVGRFEPVGTFAPYRRQGLARVAMVDGVRRMRARGTASATVEHDATNAPATSLYASLGFTLQFETVGFRRAR